MLQEFRDCFALSDEEVGRTHLVQHVIDTGDAQPIKWRPWRLPLACQQACDEAVEKILQADLIGPSDSPWATAVVMVPKKVDWRLFRLQTGEWCNKEGFILIHNDESLDLVSGSSWISSLDVRSGYYKVLFAAESRPKTALKSCVLDYVTLLPPLPS